MTLSAAAVRARLAAPDLPEALPLLGFAPEDADATMALRARALTDDAAIERICAYADELHRRLGDVTRTIEGEVWQRQDDGTAADGPLAILTFLVTLPEIRAFHRARGIPEAISWRSLADLGQQVAVHRLAIGEFGLHTQNWVTNAWVGGLYWLGRLQFTLERTDGQILASAHIPRTGPLDPAAVDASFARVAPFFARHFPEHPIAGLHCHSWLLDPQLAQVLPAHSNIAAFGRRWRLTGHADPGTADVLFFVFARRGQVDLDTLPRTSSLQRGVLEHLQAGGTWQTCTGTLPLPDGAPDPAAGATSPVVTELTGPGAEAPESLVREFHRVYDVPVGSAPSLDSGRVPMRMALIAEEFAELVRSVHGREAEAVMVEAYERAAGMDGGARDAVGAADALGDLVYVLYGMALECGIPLTEVLAEIQASNLSKLGADGRPVLRADGKVLKGPGYRRPDIAAVLGRRSAPD
ncbi:acyltransferase domain-containing protein [Ruania suaedae]|uniref:acyltransferase domain-containing protein n=1 Tax=Ruania suaedae TaxID=2897774 RepID=UPI001E53A5B3|nr:acyltransferase domain-containing protein [Ruania suaedae]UFU02792.1 acyltransferase domain-containing protein [Ruania suaedae]